MGYGFVISLCGLEATFKRYMDMNDCYGYKVSLKLFEAVSS